MSDAMKRTACAGEPRRPANRAERRKRPVQAQRMRLPFAMETPDRLRVRRHETIASLAGRQKFRTPVVAVLNGEPVLRRDNGWNRRLRRGDELTFIEYPAGGGGGGKSILRGILNIALVAVSTYLLGPAGLGLTGAALGVGVAAAQIAGGQLINALLPPEVPSAAGFRGNGETASPTYSLSSVQNTARLGLPRPRHYGLHMMVPDLDAASYTEYAGNDQYLYQVLNCGLGDYAPRKVMLADTEIWNDVDGFTGAFEDIDLEFVAPGNPVTLFPTSVVTAPEVNGLALPGTNEEGAGPVGPFTANAAGTEANHIAFDVEWPQGAGRYTNSGGLATVTTSLRFEAREIDAAGDPLGDWIVLDEDDFTFSTLTPQRVSLRFPMEAGRYEGRVTRTNDLLSETNERARDACVWTAFRAYLAEATGSINCTRLAIRMRATGQLSGLSSRLWRVLQVAKLPVFLGFVDGVPQWSAAQETRSIMAAAMDVLRNAEYGAGWPDARIDLAKFASLESTWTARGETFDGIFDSKTSCWAALMDILRVGRSEPQMNGDTVTAVRDEPRDVPTLVLSPQNCNAGSFSSDYIFDDEDAPDAVIVEFWNEETWAPDEVLCKLEGSLAERPARVQFFGCTAYDRAWRYGMHRAAVHKYRRIFPRVASGLEGRLVGRGKQVLLAHPLPQWGAHFDVEAYDAASKLLTLDGETGIEGEAWLHLRNRRGRPWGPCRVEPASPSQLLLNADDVAALGSPATFIQPSSAAEPTAAVIGEVSGEAAQEAGPLACLVDRAIPSGRNAVELYLVNDDARVYTADEGEPPPPDTSPAPPSAPARPVLQPISVSQNIGTVYAPRLSYSALPAAGAALVIWSISYDHVTWTEIKEGSAAWSGQIDVQPGTVWIACTVIGPGGRDRKEVFRDLTVTEEVPGEVTGVSSTPFAEHCFIDYALPQVAGATEEGLKGVIARYSASSGFDPEDEEAFGDTVFTVRNEPATSRLLVPLIGSPTYIRIGAYNVFGEAGLNWSSEIAVTPAKLTVENFSTAVTEALANAEAIDGEWVVRVDSNGRIAGVAIVEEGAAGETVVAGWLVDSFQIAHPTVNGGDPFPVFVVEDGVAKINKAQIELLTVEELSAALAEFGTLTALKFHSPIGPGQTIDDALFVIDLEAPYILMRKPAP